MFDGRSPSGDLAPGLVSEQLMAQQVGSWLPVWFYSLPEGNSLQNCTLECHLPRLLPDSGTAVIGHPSLRVDLSRFFPAFRGTESRSMG